MFFKRYDNLSANLTKTFRSKKNLPDTASQFSELASSQDQTNPFQYGLIALAKFGEMKCYEKLEDTQKFIRTAIIAGRYFIKSAKFNYEISRQLRDTWVDPLSDGIQCYRSAILTLTSIKKYNLAVSILNELGEVELFFGHCHNAGNAFEESSRLCAQYNLHPRVFMDSLLKCIECYTKCNHFDLALMSIMSTIVSLETNYIDYIDSSTFLKSKMNELCAARCLLLTCNGQFNEALNNAKPNIVDGELLFYIINFIELAKEKDKKIDQIKEFVAQLKENKKLPCLITNIIERYYLPNDSK